MMTSTGGGVVDVWCDRCGEWLGTSQGVKNPGPSIDYCPALEDCVAHLGDTVRSLDDRLAEMEAKVQRAATTVRTAFAGAKAAAHTTTHGQEDNG